MARKLWQIETCPTCEGSGFDYCERCEGACEHDRVCPRCHGYEEVAAALNPWQEMAAAFGTGGGIYRTKRAAEESIREEKDGPAVTISLPRA